MRSYIETWHQNELNRQMLRFYKGGTGLILILGLILLTQIEILFALMLVLLAKLLGMLALFLYWRQKREDYRPTAFMLDKRFDGHDFFPTVLEFTPASGVVHEQFTEITKARFAQIMPDSSLVDLKKELKYFWFQAIVVLILLLLLSLLAAAAAASAANSDSNQGTEQSEQEQSQNQNQNQNSNSGGDSPQPEESKSEEGESESESESESGGEQESESESEAESEGEKESESGSSAQKEQSSESQAQPETEQAVELNDEKAEGEPDATVSSSKSPEVTDAPPDLPHLQSKPKPPELVMPQIPQEEEQDQGKYDSKAYGVLGSGDAGEIQKLETTETLKRQAIRNTQQKLEGFLSRPNVPKEYKERLKRLFESREEYKEDM